MVTFLRCTRIPFFCWHYSRVVDDHWEVYEFAISIYQVLTTSAIWLFVVCCSLFVDVCCLLFVVCCLLFVVCCLLGSLNSPLPELAPPRICVWCRLGARTTSPLSRFSSSVDCKNFGGVTIVQKN